MPVDIIREYLVSLGFDVDHKSFNEANRAVNTLDKIVQKFKKTFAENKGLQKFSESMDKMLTSVGANIAKFVASTEGLILGAIAAITVAVLALGTILTAAMGKFMINMAKADMQIQIFARRMFTTVENARSLKAVMDAMGLKDLDELKDVALNPELRKQFFELRKLTAGLGLGSQATEGMRNIRALNLEFQKLGIITQYFWTNLAGKLGFFLKGPMKDVQNMMAGFNKNLALLGPNVAHDIAGLLGVFYKLIQIGVKLETLWMRIPGLGKIINNVLDDLGAVLDLVNALLDLVNRVVDKVSIKMPEHPMADLYKDGQKTLGGILYYIRKIADMLTSAWQTVMNFLGPIRAWVAQKIGNVRDFLEDPVGTAQKAAAGVAQTFSGKSGGHLSFMSNVKLSKDISTFLEKLKPRLTDNYVVTAGVATKGHLSHGNGRAVDIGLGGHNDQSIIALMKAVLATPGLRIANLELSMPHYRKILRDLDSQGVNYAGRVSNTKSKYSHGDHLHVGLQPLQVAINVHGVHDPKAVAAAIHDKFQEVAMRHTRTQQGSFV